MIEGYSSFQPIGHGGFSTVYLAKQEIFDRLVAVKIMHADLRDPDAKRRFLRECRATGRLTGHPNIITVFDAGTTVDHRPYLAMEYFPGGSLAELVRRSGPLPVAAALNLVIPVADALNTAHRNGILHRDLKPANILLRRPDDPVLSDFGIASLIEGTEAATVSAAFTPAYAAPEVLLGESPQTASDIFALGATLFTLLTGTPPFSGRVPTQILQRILAGDITPTNRDDIPAELHRLLARVLAAEPSQRPGGEELLAALRALAGTAAQHGDGLAPVPPIPWQEEPAEQPAPAEAPGPIGQAAPAGRPNAAEPGRPGEASLPGQAVPGMAPPGVTSAGAGPPLPPAAGPTAVGGWAAGAAGGQPNRAGTGILSAPPAAPPPGPPPPPPFGPSGPQPQDARISPTRRLRGRVPIVASSVLATALAAVLGFVLLGPFRDGSAPDPAARPATGTPVEGTPADAAPTEPASAPRPSASASAPPAEAGGTPTADPRATPSTDPGGQQPPQSGQPAPTPPPAAGPTAAPTAAAPPPAAPSPRPPSGGGGAGSCSSRAEPVTDYRQRTWQTRYYCSTYVGSPVYANVAAGSGGALDDSGYMEKASRVWVICQLNGRGNPTIQGNTNTWWLYTQGDSSRSNSYGYTKAWGYLPATAVAQGGQDEPIPGVPECPGYL